MAKWLRANHHFAVVIQNQSLAGHLVILFFGGWWYRVGRSCAFCWWISHSSGLVWAFCCLYCLVNDLIYLFIHISTSVCLCLFVCLFVWLFVWTKIEANGNTINYPIVIEPVSNLKTNHTTTTKNDVDIRSWNTPNISRWAPTSYQWSDNPYKYGFFSPQLSISFWPFIGTPNHSICAHLVDSDRATSCQSYKRLHIATSPPGGSGMSDWDVRGSHVGCRKTTTKHTQRVTGWWFQPIWKILVKMGIFHK